MQANAETELEPALREVRWENNWSSGNYWVVARRTDVHDLVEFVVCLLAFALVTPFVGLGGAAALSRLMAAAAAAAVSVVWVAEISSVAAVQGGLGVRGLEQRRVYGVVGVHRWTAPEIVLNAETYESSGGTNKGVHFQVSSVARGGRVVEAVASITFPIRARVRLLCIVREVYEKVVFLDAVLFGVPRLVVTFV